VRKRHGVAAIAMNDVASRPFDLTTASLVASTTATDRFYVDHTQSYTITKFCGLSSAAAVNDANKPVSTGSIHDGHKNFRVSQSSMQAM
jgi:hypothetical protein